MASLGMWQAIANGIAAGAAGMDANALASFLQQAQQLQQAQAQQGVQQQVMAAAAGQQLQLQQQPASASLEAEEDTVAGEEEEEEDEEEDEAPTADDGDSDYDASEEERGRGGEEEGSESDPDYQEARPAAKRRREPTPPGARRSVRIKDRVVDVGHELEDDDDVEEEEEAEQAPRRGLRSAGPVQLPPPPGSSAVPSRNPSAGPGSRAGSEQPPPPPRAQGAGGLAPLPNPKDIRREFTHEEMSAELAEVRNMWELAAVFDFLTLFRPQLKLSRQFEAEELEHVLAFSDGRDGLLADLHIDIMRGISPKQEVPRDAWQVHLANKIKYHWRPLLSGAHCPFKPDKYFEAYTYARLPAVDRVRALHFLCTIRCDREDIQFRVAETYRERTAEEQRQMLTAHQAAIISGRPAKALQLWETPDTFRRKLNGVDSEGGRYYCISLFHSTGFRLYRDLPAPPCTDAAAGGGGSTGEAPGQTAAEAAAAAVKHEGSEAGTAAAAAAAAGADSGARAQQGQAAAEEQQQQQQGGDDGDGDDSGAESDAAGTLPSRQQRLRSYQVPDDPEPEGRWELVASTLEEFQALATKFSGSQHPGELALANVIRSYLLPTLMAKKLEDERRAKAAERVQRKLGVAAGSLGPAATGSGGSGAVASGGHGDATAAVAAAAAPADGGRDVGGRSRRARQRVNYAFTEFDEAVRSAIRHTQRGEEDSEDEGMGKRRRRRAPSPSDPVEAARGGLRRGRSAAAIKEDVVDVNYFVDERQLRMAAAHQQHQHAAQRGSRASSRAASRAGSGVDLAQLAQQQQQQAEAAEDGQQAAAVQPNGRLQGSDASAYVTAAPGRGRGRGGGGGRKKAVQYEEDDESEEDSGEDGAGDAMSEDEYVPRSRR